MSRKEIVVISGAWHLPLHFEPTAVKLEEAGYKVHCVQMPAVGNSNPPKDLSEDVAAAQALVLEAIGDGNEVVVFAHSWGGLIASSALGPLAKKTREAEGKKGGVVRVGYIASFILPEGVPLMGALPEAPYWFDIKEPYVYAKDPAIFYNDLPEEEQKRWHSQILSHSWATLKSPTTGESWKTIPTSYLVCEDDKAIPVAAQDGMIKSVQDAGFEVDVSRIKASHSPFLSKPAETAAWIRKVAGEDIQAP